MALARALVQRPAVLLLDEPLSNLDAKLRVRVREDIREIQQRLGITTVVVTHDQDEALSISDRVAVMNEGRIEQYSTPVDLYRAPVTLFVGGFVGAMNTFEGTVSDRGPQLVARGSVGAEDPRRAREHHRGPERHPRRPPQDVRPRPRRPGHPGHGGPGSSPAVTSPRSS